MKQFLFFLLLSWAMAPGASLADTVVSLDQANDLAQQALAQNDFAAADQLTSAVLAQRPSDARALIVRAILLRNARQFDEARRAASSAWENAETKAARYDAAILAADINNLQGRYTRAQFWLRRADQAAFLPEQKQLVAQSYAAVRQRNPLQVNLRFSLKPSNNVNNGAETTVIDIGGLPLEPGGRGR